MLPYLHPYLFGSGVKITIFCINFHLVFSWSQTISMQYDTAYTKYILIQNLNVYRKHNSQGKY